MPGPFRRVLIFGGAGLVGRQVARQIGHEFEPSRIVLSSLYEHEIENCLPALAKEFPKIRFSGVYGDIFVRYQHRNLGRGSLLESAKRTKELFEDAFGNRADASDRSNMARIIRRCRPDVIVDCVNTATGISYQDIYTISRQDVGILQKIEKGRRDGTAISFEELTMLYTLIVSQPIPQLIRHVLLINQAMRDVGTKVYLKVGTTGTGGMGLNIPYTHSEDKPSEKLMSKTAIAFAHTGLLFLMARTPGGPIVKEIKPGAMIGYNEISFGPIRQGGAHMPLFDCQELELKGNWSINMESKGFRRLGDLKTVFVDTGENGWFTRGEFETITNLGQMEFVTPEEIARNVILELDGVNTGKDVIAAIDGSVMAPSYRAGYLRQQVLDRMEELEQSTGSHSVALGQLGPPELSKLLFEAHLLKLSYGSLKKAAGTPAKEMAQTLERALQKDKGLRQTIASIGVPILLPDGRSVIRGPHANIPEYRGGHEDLKITRENIDAWSEKGWVDLRVKNCNVWRRRFRKLISERDHQKEKGSAAGDQELDRSDQIRIGSVVAWIFEREHDGYRMK